MILLCDFIKRHELDPLGAYFTLSDLRKACKKAASSLGVMLGSSKMPGAIFIKVRIGSNVKGRMITLFLTVEGDVIPLLIRLKKDKHFGMNMSLQNPHVVDQLDINLDNVTADISAGRYVKLDF